MKYRKNPPSMGYRQVIALDVGERRIGVAASDPLGIMAQGVGTIYRKKPEEDVDAVLRYVREREAQAIVVGLPRNMDGSYGFAADRSREFVSRIREKTDIPIEMEDERLTTVSAEKILLEADVSRSRRKTVIDRLSAVIILESYLRRQERRKETMSEDNERIVELIDEEGKKVLFEHQLTVHYQDADYALVVPVEGLEPADEDEGELVALKIVPGETEDEDTYEGVEDEELLDILYKMYLEEMESMEEDDL